MSLSCRLLIAGTVLAATAGPAWGQAPARRGNAPQQPPAAHAEAPLVDAVHPAMIAQRGPGRINLMTGDVVTAELPNLLDIRPAALSPEDHHLLQLSEPITPERRDQLAALGIELGQYLPTWTYHVSINPRVDLDALADLPWVLWLGEYQPEWKIHPRIGTRTFATESRQQLRAEGHVALIVTLFEGAALDNVEQQLAEIDGLSIEHVEMAGRNALVSVIMPLDSVQLLADINDVQFVEEAYEVTFRNDTTRWIIQSNTDSVTPLYDNGLFGEGQIVGILDGRIRHDHCSFEDPEGDPFGPDHRKIEAYNSSTGTDLHGTHVAGTVCGDAGPGENPNLRGIAYEGRLVFNTTPSFTEAGILARLDEHHSQGARIHTNSWGNDGTTDYDSLARGFDVFSRNNEDDLVLLAVTNTSTLRNPENAKNLLACGGTDPEPNQSDHCTGGVGPTDDGRRKPEAYAPGCSTISAGTGTCTTASLSGTSMATPAIAGIAMMVREYFVDGYYPSGSPNGLDAFTPTGALLKAMVLNSCVDMTGVTGYPSDLEGWGRVLADEALYFTGDSRSLYVEDVRHASGLSTSDQHEYFMQVNSDAETLKITMTFMDEAGAAGAALPVVNDIDLEVESPTGTVYKGNVFSGGVSVSGGSTDPLNNVEQVHVNNPTAGLWTIRVIGTDVSVGPQGYAIAASGDIQPGQPPLTLELLSGPIDQIAPGVPNDYTILVTDGSEMVDPSSVEMFYRFDGGAFSSVPMSNDGGGMFSATLPEASCTDEPELLFLALGDGGTPVWLPSGGPPNVFAPIVGTVDEVINDNFESDLGWTTAAEPSVTSGFWERGVPVDDDSWQYDPQSDSDGSGQCYLTQNTNGNTDVDGGRVTLTSPVLAYSGGDLTISYDYYLNLDPVDGSDGLVVEMTDAARGGVWTEIARHENDNDLAWTNHVITSADLATAGVSLGATFQVRFIAIDEGASAAVEAGVDAFSISEVICDEPNPCPGDVANNDGLVNLDDLLAVIGNWGSDGSGGGDTNNDGAVDLADLLNVIGGWGVCD